MSAMSAAIITFAMAIAIPSLVVSALNVAMMAGTMASLTCLSHVPLGTDPSAGERQFVEGRGRPPIPQRTNFS
jgi:hypothetical protein